MSSRPIRNAISIGRISLSTRPTSCPTICKAARPGCSNPASREPHEFWFPLGDVQVGMPGDRRNVAALENLITGERYPVEWGGIRLRIDPVRDPALLFRCLA